MGYRINSVVKIMSLEGSGKTTIQRIYENEKTKSMHSCCKCEKKLCADRTSYGTWKTDPLLFETYSIKNYAIDGIGNRSARSSVLPKSVQDWTTQFKRK